MIRLLFTGCLLATFALATLPASGGGRGGNWAHFAAFGALAWLAGSTFQRVRAEALFAGLLAFGGIVELCQWALPTGRSADLNDVAADAIAAFLGLAATRRYGPAGPAARAEPSVLVDD